MGDSLVNPVKPTSSGWYEVNLSDEKIKYLWKICNKSKTKENEMKHRLAGNITQSYNLEDEDDYFWKSVLYNLTDMYHRDNGGEHPDIRPHVDEKSLKPRFIPFLKEFWVNYQYKHEFNPLHDHSGVYSFVIWLKIPYTYEQQSNLDFQKGLKKRDKKAGTFEFQYYDMLGRATNRSYFLGKEYEGRMLFFPSRLGHCVYPFYNSDEERVSISGNVWLKNVSQEEYEDYKEKSKEYNLNNTRSTLEKLGITL